MAVMLLVFTVPVTVVLTLALRQKFHKEITPTDIDEAFHEGELSADNNHKAAFNAMAERARKAEDKVAWQDRRIASIMREVVKQENEIRMLRVLAGLDQGDV